MSTYYPVDIYAINWYESILRNVTPILRESQH